MNFNTGCLFCNKDEKGYKPAEGISFVCSYCTQLLIRAKPENLRNAYDKAKKFGRKELVKFLERYVEEDKDAREEKLIYNVVERDLDRKGVGREIRSSSNKGR